MAKRAEPEAEYGRRAACTLGAWLLPEPSPGPEAVVASGEAWGAVFEDSVVLADDTGGRLPLTQAFRPPAERLTAAAVSFRK
jgi:hypothetical protein